MYYNKAYTPPTTMLKHTGPELLEKSTLNESLYYEYLTSGRHHELAACIVRQVLKEMNLEQLHPCLHQQATQACYEVLLRHTDCCYASFMKGVRSAMGIILKASCPDVPPLEWLSAQAASPPPHTEKTNRQVIRD